MSTRIRYAALAAVVLALTSFAPHKALTWMALGDSITYLDGHPEESDHRTTLGYMARVTAKLPYVTYANHGHNGWTTSRMAASIDREGIEKADVYSVFLGTNDWWSGAALGTLADYENATGGKTLFGAYRVIINKIRSLNPDAHVILIAPMQRGDFVYWRNFKNNAYGSYRDKNGRRLSEFADAVRQIAEKEKFAFVDLYHKSGMTHKNMVRFKRLKDPATGAYRNYRYPKYADVPFNPETDEYPYPLDAVDMTYDGLHPSDKGLEVIAKMLVKEMKKY